MNLLQTDCAINSGNSGGALFNLYGEVIGVTNAKYSGSSSSGEASIDNIGFAIPINSILPIVESIIEKGYISKPYIGVSVVSVSAESQAYGLPAGAAVQVVNPDGPALMAGLQVSDIITHVNGEAIKSASELISLISASRIGEVLQLTLYRQGQTLTIDVTVGEQVQSATPQQPQQTQPSHSYQDFPWSYFGW
jgi:serine protease Do